MGCGVNMDIFDGEELYCDGGVIGRIDVKRVGDSSHHVLAFTFEDGGVLYVAVSEAPPPGLAQGRAGR
jgi:hypothetical protein